MFYLRNVMKIIEAPTWRKAKKDQKINEMSVEKQ